MTLSNIYLIFIFSLMMTNNSCCSWLTLCQGQQVQLAAEASGWAGPVLSAPISNETVQFFLDLNIHLYEPYGMSESTGPHFMSGPKAYTLPR